jgi:hypothetical protein
VYTRILCGVKERWLEQDTRSENDVLWREREIARQVRGVKLCRAIKVPRQAAKVESERRVLSRANLAGSQIALKVGFQVVCSVTTQTRPPTFTPQWSYLMRLKVAALSASSWLQS